MKLLPKVVDNNFDAPRVVLWLFIIITIITIARSLVHIFHYDGGAYSIAHINFPAFTNGGKDSIISLFALWGLSQLIMGIFYFIVLLRYKSLIPLMYLFILIEYLGRYFISFYKPLDTLNTPSGAYADYVFIFISVIMLIIIFLFRGKNEVS